MNKKRLSVVMAGAMLATSVAPVLAAETTATEIGLSQKKLVEKEIMDLVNSKKISTNAILKGTDFVSTDVANIMTTSETTPESAYGVKVLDADGNLIKDLKATLNTSSSNLPNADITYNVEAIEEILQLADTKLKDLTIQVVERENSKFLGQVIPGSEITGSGTVSEANTFKYADFADFDALNTALKDSGLYLDPATGKPAKESGSTGNERVKNEFIDSVKLENGVATVKLAAVKDLTSDKAENLTIELKAGSPKLYFNLPLDAEGNLIEGDLTSTDKVMNCVGFAKKETFKKSQLTLATTTDVKAYKFVDDSAKEEKVTYLASDLYDGFALTAKGTEIKSDILNAAKVAEETGKNATVVLSTPQPSALTNGVASFTVTYYASHKDNPTKKAKEVTIKSTNLDEVKSLYKMLQEKSTFRVGIVGGQNRYETAVNVAKAAGAELFIADAGTAGEADTAKDLLNNNIVIVNGDSLVDGLAAAPLAASLNKVNGTPDNSKTLKHAPVLLSKTDELPTATKEYIEELANDISKKDRAKYTVNLVGGESVLSEELVKEIKAMGFKVERFGGDNREETSLEVANAIDPTAAKGAFIVGGNGEADAMSISAVAASDTDKTATNGIQSTPIIVSSVHGLTKDALKYVKARKDNTMTIVGGESVVSAEEYAKLDELTSDTNAVKRIAGKNRFETNAKVIEEFYKNSGVIEDVKGVVMVKDGVAKESDLVDALSAANYAAGMKAPIVLASTSLKDVQKNALLKMDLDGDIKTDGTVAQVGIGAERTVLETIAGLFSISNK